MPRLHFGKYEGWEIRDVPEDYLSWLMNSSQQTADMCKAELERRENEEEASMSWMERIIKTGYRELSKKHHPDFGGQVQDMQELNASYDALFGALRGKGRT
jgi:Putative quorum-sensing-regulated virulence factor